MDVLKYSLKPYGGRYQFKRRLIIMDISKLKNKRFLFYDYLKEIKIPNLSLLAKEAEKDPYFRADVGEGNCCGETLPPAKRSPSEWNDTIRTGIRLNDVLEKCFHVKNIEKRKVKHRIADREYELEENILSNKELIERYVPEDKQVYLLCIYCGDKRMNYDPWSEESYET
jgi:hypothetical protein